MHPMTAVNLILLGSSFAITVSLAAVTFVFFILGDDYPRLQYEFDPLLSSLGIFLLMTTVSATSFYTLIKKHRLRYFAQAAQWLALYAVGWYYWP